MQSQIPSKAPKACQVWRRRTHMSSALHDLKRHFSCWNPQSGFFLFYDMTLERSTSWFVWHHPQPHLFSGKSVSVTNHHSCWCVVFRLDAIPVLTKSMILFWVKRGGGWNEKLVKHFYQSFEDSSTDNLLYEVNVALLWACCVCP